MIAVTTPSSDPVELHDDTEGALSYAAWVSGLTGPARASLVAAQRPQRASPTASLQAPEHDCHGLLLEVVSLITEVRDFLLNQKVVRDYYSTEQAAKILGRANWTVREWCRLGRVHAEKRRSGRGRARDWTISHAELLRIEKEGLLPAGKH